MTEISLWELFYKFFLIGLFTIGGGMVAITLMQQQIVDTGLLSADQFYNMIAISESTPGPVGVNMATYVGYKFYGIPGAVVTSIAEVLPSLICILIIARIIIKVRENKCVQYMFSYLRPVTTGMILVIAVRLCSSVLFVLPQSWNGLLNLEEWKNFVNWSALSAFLIFLYIRKKYKLHPFFIVILGAGFGILFC